LLGALLAIAMVLLAGLVLTGRLRLEPVLTGSMAPRFPAGTLVAVTPVDGHAVQVGDVVMFVPPKPYGTPTGGPIMHRVISVGHGPDGHLQLRTKGDANAAADPWVLDGDRGGFARLRVSSVAAGRAVVMLRATTHFPAVLVWPGLLLLLLAGRLSRRKDKAPTPADGPVPARVVVPAQRHYQPRHAAPPRRAHPSASPRPSPGPDTVVVLGL
jgi:signal peptidase